MSLHMKAVIAGLLFGAWPFFMNRSGLSGNLAAAFFAIVTISVIMPATLYSNGLTIPAANWTMVSIAGIIGGIGILLFNGMLTEASAKAVGDLFVITLVMQIVVAATYQVIVNGGVPVEKIFGYAAAAVAAYLLLK